MKKILIILFLLISIKGISQDRNYAIYPTLGVDLGGAVPFPFSDIPDGAGGTPKPYPTLGIGGEYYLNEKWNLGIELNYHLIAFSADADVVSQPFYFDNQQDVIYFSGETKTDVELRMVEFPIIATFNYKPKKAIIFGGYYSRILEGEFLTEGRNGVMSDDKSITDNAVLPGVANTNYDFNDDLDSYDYGLFLGYRYNYNGKLMFATRLHVGFKSIFERSFENIDYEMYQVRLSLGISYKLID